MPTTISISLASISGEAGPFTLFLRKTSDRAIVNTGGDALTEVEVATVKTGVWTATVAETIPAEDCHARIYEGASEAAAAILIDSILYESETEIGKEPSSGGGGDAEQATLLAVQTTVNTISSQTSQITGSRINTVGPVSAAGDITLIVGKDYKVASESELTISVPDTAGALHADFTSATLAASKAFGMSRANGDADISGTVSSVTYAANVTTFKIEIDADQLPDTLELAYDYTYQIERVTSGGDKVVGVQGAGEVKMRAV